MRSFDPTELSYLQNRTGIKAHALLWVLVRNRSTGTRVGVGLWTGEEDRDFLIDGYTRTYGGAGAVLGLDSIVMQAGLTVRMQRMTLSPLAPEAVAMIREYDAGLAPAEIHRAMFDPGTGNLIAPCRRIWKGVVDSAPVTTAELGGQSNIDLVLASAAQALTVGSSLTKSDATQQLRGGDRMRRYKSTTGKVPVAWGEVRK
jgi:hypothetical protein